MFDAFMTMSKLAIEPTEQIYTLYTACMLVANTPVYFHSVREYLVIYALFLYTTKSPVQRNIFTLFD